MRGVTQEDAQSIQCTLADYFRYVAGHVAYEYQGEAIARQAAILDAVKRSMAAAVECTDRVAELERKLEEARLALDVRQGQVKRLEAEADALRGLCDGQAVYKVPDEGIPSAAPARGKCAVNGAPNGRHCPASFAFDIRRCTGSAPCKHRREGE